MGGAIPTGITLTPDKFIHIGPFEVLFLLALGFFGGMLSGFIGSGGAFVLTPGMMSIGVPGPIAVASNMCHKFPKAMIGAWRRKKVGHLDVKLAFWFAISAIAGVQVGIQIQRLILQALGVVGTNLYVSCAFLVVLPTVAAFCLRDVVKARRYGIEDTEPGLAKKLEQKFRLPPIIEFKTAGRKQSLWLTLPCGFGTGFLAATIAVGGFIGVPTMIYVIGAPSFVASGTELGVAFVMGSTGTWTWAYLLGAVDFRLTTLILAASLIGVQLGAVGTTYVRQYYIKLAMAVVMLIVTVSRACAVPGYLQELGWISIDPGIVAFLNSLVFPTMVLAMVSVTPIVIVPMIKVRRLLASKGVLADALVSIGHRGKLVQKTILFGAISLANYYLLFKDPYAWPQFVTSIPHAAPIMAVALATAVVAVAIYWSLIHGNFAHCLLDLVKITALRDEVAKSISRSGYEGLMAWISRKAETANPGIKANPKPLRVIVGTDGSEHARKAVKYAASLAMRNGGEVILLHVVAMDPRIPPSPWVTPEIEARDRKFIEDLRATGEAMVKKEAELIKDHGINVKTRVEFGDPAETILKVAEEEKADMIVLGVRGVSAWKRLILGSVSERVLEEAKVPVLIIR